jgi:hypothetical protein
MYMVRHDLVFIQNHIGKMLRYFLPKFQGLFACFGIYYFVTHDFTEKIFPVFCAYCHKIPPFGCVIVIFQADSNHFLTFISNNQMTYLCICAECNQIISRHLQRLVWALNRSGNRPYKNDRSHDELIGIFVSISIGGAFHGLEKQFTMNYWF